MTTQEKSAAGYARSLITTSEADQKLEDSPAYPSKAWERMMRATQLPDALMGGTQRMRDEAETWYPADDKETPASWQARVQRATLWPAFRKTVEYLAGRPHEQPLDLTPITDAVLRGWLETDIDGQDHDLSVFSYEVHLKAHQRGMHYILVDNHPLAGKGKKSDDEALGLRPRMLHMPISRVWRVIPGRVLGREIAIQVHIYSPRVEKTGEFGTRIHHELKVYRLVIEADQPVGVDVYTYRQLPDKGGSLEKDDWPLVSEEGAENPRRIDLKEIPLVLIPGNMIGFHEASPGLIDLAYMNLAQFQSDGDQRHILHVARVPLLVLKGVQAGFEKIWLGVRRMFRFDSDKADLAWVEAKGDSIKMGKEDIDDLKASMSQIGGDQLNPRPGHPTATGKKIDYHADNSRLNATVLCIEQAINVAIRLMAELGGRKPPAPIHYADFDTIASQEDLDKVQKLRETGDLSRLTLWSEYQRRGTLSDDFDPVAELKRLAKEEDDEEARVAAAADALERKLAGEEDEEDEEDDDENDDQA